jgi:hypothetical protein
MSDEQNATLNVGKERWYNVDEVGFGCLIA